MIKILMYNFFPNLIYRLIMTALVISRKIFKKLIFKKKKFKNKKSIKYSIYQIFLINWNLTIHQKSVNMINIYKT